MPIFAFFVVFLQIDHFVRCLQAKFDNKKWTAVAIHLIFLLDAFVFANKLLNKGNVFVHQAGENSLVVSCTDVLQCQVGGNKCLLATCNALVDCHKKVLGSNVAVDVFRAKVINKQHVHVQQVFHHKLFGL